MAVVFASNTAYSSTGNIFSTVPSFNLYFMNMPIPSQMSGVTPKYSCDAGPKDVCSELFQQAPCALDNTSSGTRVYCSCELGWQGGAGTSKRVCQKCSAGRWSDQFGVTSNNKCTACSAGTGSTATGSTSGSVCTDCVAGRYNTETTGASSCTDCFKGKSSSTVGASVVST